MSGHAGDVIATEEQIGMARNAILMHLGATGIAKGFDSLSDALDALGMWDFIENQAKVTAQYAAFSVRDNAIIHELTMAGAYVKLDLGWNKDD